MIQFEHSVTIDRPLHEVFEYIADPTKFPEWQSGVVQSTLVSDGPIGKGTKFDEVVRIMGWKIRTSCEITQYEPDEKMCFRATSRPISYAGQFAVKPTEDGTRLTLLGAGQLRGFWRLTEPFFGPEVKRETATELKRIKEIVESKYEPERAAV